MGSKSNNFEQEILKLIFNNVDIADIGDVIGIQGSTTTGSLSLALFQSIPDEDNSDALECDYTNYSRLPINRNTDEWFVSYNGEYSQVTNNNEIIWPLCGGGSNTVFGFGICKGNVAGVDDAIYYGTTTTSLLVQANIAPRFGAGGLIIKED